MLRIECKEKEEEIGFELSLFCFFAYFDIL